MTKYLKNSVLFKPNLIFFSISSLICNLFVYVFQFYIFKNDVDYFLCTNVYDYQLTIFSKNLNLIYPESCDLRTYFIGVDNFLQFFTIDNYVYQDRPVFVFYIFIFYSILKIFLVNTNFTSLSILKISFFFGQLVLTIFLSLFLYKIFKYLNNNSKEIYYFFPLFISLSPMFKWHIYESTSMTFTFLIFIFGIYIVLNHDATAHLFFITGILYLVHRSAFLILVFFVLYNLQKKTFSIIKLKRVSLFFLPIAIYYFFIFLIAGFSDHQAEEYRQFVWILDFLQNKETLIGGYFCQTPKLAISCYTKDVINLIIYLSVPLIFIILMQIKHHKYMNFNNRNLIRTAAYFCLLVNVFWMFIGWYPPIRFSYYGIGNLVLFLSIYFLYYFKSKLSLFLYVFSYISYFLLINHWNHPDLIVFSSLIRVSILFYVTSLVMSEK